MSSTYAVGLLDHNGVQVAMFDAWENLEVEHTLNSFSTHTLQLNDSDPRTELFDTDSFVMVYRRDANAGLGWYREYAGFHRTGEHTIDQQFKPLFNSFGRGMMDLIHRREVLQFSQSAEAAKTGPGETVMKAYVDENAGPSAAGRVIRAGNFPGFNVAPDGGQGDQWTGDMSFRNLLDALNEISLATLVDFDVVITNINPMEFEFRTYWPQRGADRSSGNTVGNTPAVFSPGLGNMLNPTTTHARLEEGNVVAVLGAGQQTDRTVIVVDDPEAIIASPWNDIESSIDGNTVTYIGEDLTSVGTTQLRKLEAKQEFTFDVLQTPTSVYGRDYFLGDLVTVQFGNISATKKIVSVKIQVRGGKETLTATFGDLPNV